MTLPTFDSELHQIALGEAGGTQYGFLLQGAYRKSLQNRPTPQEYGGSNDLLSSPVLSRWTQDDFSGGAFRRVWGTDSAMFAASSGMLPRRQDVSARTVPPIHSKSVGYATGPLTARDLIAVGNYLYVFDTQMRRFDTTAENFDATTALGSAIVCACYEPNERVFYVRISGDYLLYRFTEACVASSTASYADGTSSVGITHLTDLGAYLVGIDANSYVWTIALNKNRATAPTWTSVGRLIGSTIATTVYNGQVYILTGGGLGRARLSTFDGTNILPILEWPYNFTPVSMAVYGGKIYVAGNVESASGTASFAQLYEITGSSLRLVRSFEDDLPAGTVAGALEVVDGVLLMAAKGWGLVGYDLTSDSLWGAHRYASDLTALSVQHIASSRDRIYLYGDNGGTTTSGLYRAAIPGQTVAQYACSLETSDFGPEPARLKRWSEVHVQSKGGAPTVEYSTDGGVTYTTLSVTTTTEGQFRNTVADLSQIASSTRIRFRFTYHATDPVTVQELVAFTVGFLFLETGKHSWALVINGSDQVTRIDGTSEHQTPAEIGEQLDEWVSERTSLTFTDLSGNTHNVNVLRYEDFKPVVGSPPHEGLYSVTLTEV